MRFDRRSSLPCSAGFTLIELMVGLAIGMLATVVIVQVMSVFEAQRRTTTGTADAQINGSIALYKITREAQMAGYTLLPVTNSALECTALTVDGVADASVPNRLSPIVIADGVATATTSASDVITIRYGGAPMGGVPTPINAVDPAAKKLTITGSVGCAVNDRSLVINGNACFMSTVNAVDATSVTIANTTGAVGGANVACLGAWNEITYRVNGGNLERCNLTTAVAAGGNCNLVADNTNFIPSVAGIVNLQVQYGIANTATSNQVTQWVDAVDGAGGNWATLTVPNRNRIKSVRIAVVARNAKMEQGVVSAACSSVVAASPTGLCAWDATSMTPAVTSPAPTIDLHPEDAKWASYRYRVFETVIPLRNVIWAKATL